MIIKEKIHFNIFVDPQLIVEERTEFMLQVFEDLKLKYSSDIRDLNNTSFFILFAHKKNLENFSKFKNRIIVLDSADDGERTSDENINFNSYGDIHKFLLKILIIEKHFMIQYVIKKSEKHYDQMKRINLELSVLDLQNLTEDHKNVLESLLDLEILLLGEDHIKNWNTQFKVFVKKNIQFQNLGVFTSEELIEDNNVFDDNAFILSLPFENYFLFIRLKSIDSAIEAIFIESIVTMLLRTIQVHDQQLIKNDGEIEFWEKVFSKIPYPMATISNLGDLLIYNESFAKIGILPKECLRFKDHESFEIFQQYYKVRRIEFSLNLVSVSYFVFYTSEGQEKKYPFIKANINESRNGSVDELGIISSSIAHELNNPLAGILAALSLLSLEEEWAIENQNDLDDMKNGAKRCKELIEIFLGFSKFSPVTGHSFSIKNSLDQAINLLRFRMVESNLRLDIKFISAIEKFNYSINASVLSMILYLIFSELMTAFAHEKLITQMNLSAMEGELIEFSNQIIIKINHDFEYEDKLAQSKLIQHLLIFEKFEITFLKQEIRLIYRD